jgi:hypothetical protein
MLSAAAAVLLSTALPALTRGLPGDLVVAGTARTGAAAMVEQPTPPWSQQRAPAGVLQESERPVRPQTHETASLPLDLEAWHGTVCLKGAWTLRASRSPDEPNSEATKQPAWQMQISPALVADGTRFMPGIGASTRF